MGGGGGGNALRPSVNDFQQYGVSWSVAGHLVTKLLHLLPLTPDMNRKKVESLEEKLNNYVKQTEVLCLATRVPKRLVTSRPIVLPPKRLVK